MADKTTAYSNAVLNSIFNTVALTTAFSTLSTSLYFSLHTATPGVAGNQRTNEIDNPAANTGVYVGYLRKSVLRTTGAAGFAASTTASTSPVDAVTAFPQCTATSGAATATFFGIGTDATGNGNLLMFGSIVPSIVCGANVTPEFTNASAFTEA